MRFGGKLITAVIATILLASCGSGDDPESGSDTPTGTSAANAAASLKLTCQFTPEENPDVIGAGRVTVSGTNTSGVRIDQALVTMTLTGSTGSVDATASIPYFMPGEELAQWAPVLDESGGDITGCEVTEVTGGDYAGKPQLDPEGASCEVSGTAGDWSLAADLSGVDGLPADKGKFVGIIAQLDGKRYSMEEQELPAGETTLTVTTSSDAQPTCTVRYVRDL